MISSGCTAFIGRSDRVWSISRPDRNCSDTHAVSTAHPCARASNTLCYACISYHVRTVRISNTCYACITYAPYTHTYRTYATHVSHARHARIEHMLRMYHVRTMRISNACYACIVRVTQARSLWIRHAPSSSRGRPVVLPEPRGTLVGDSYVK